MIRTQEELCIVKTPGTGQFSNSHNHVWFEILEGPDTGLRCSIPSHRHEYDDDELARKITKLSVGDIVKTVLQKENSSDSWKPKKIDLVKRS